MAEILTDLRQAAQRLIHSETDALASHLPGRDRVLMMLGRYMFSVTSAVPQSASHRVAYKWPSQDVVGGAPVLQYLGPGQHSVELPGRIYPHYRGGLDQVRAMRQLADSGDVQLLVDALGTVYGDFAITEVAETQKVFDANNAPRRIDFHLKLTRGDGGG
jgi:phage protein U